MSLLGKPARASTHLEDSEYCQDSKELEDRRQRVIEGFSVCLTRNRPAFDQFNVALKKKLTRREAILENFLLDFSVNSQELSPTCGERLVSTLRGHTEDRIDWFLRRWKHAGRSNPIIMRACAKADEIDCGWLQEHDTRLGILAREFDITTVEGCFRTEFREAAVRLVRRHYRFDDAVTPARADKVFELLGLLDNDLSGFFCRFRQIAAECPGPTKHAAAPEDCLNLLPQTEERFKQLSNKIVNSCRKQEALTSEKVKRINNETGELITKLKEVVAADRLQSTASTNRAAIQGTESVDDSAEPSRQLQEELAAEQSDPPGDQLLQEQADRLEIETKSVRDETKPGPQQMDDGLSSETKDCRVPLTLAGTESDPQRQRVVAADRLQSTASTSKAAIQGTEPVGDPEEPTPGDQLLQEQADRLEIEAEYATLNTAASCGGSTNAPLNRSERDETDPGPQQMDNGLSIGTKDCRVPLTQTGNEPDPQRRRESISRRTLGEDDQLSTEAEATQNRGFEDRRSSKDSDLVVSSRNEPGASLNAFSQHCSIRSQDDDPSCSPSEASIAILEQKSAETVDLDNRQSQDQQTEGADSQNEDIVEELFNGPDLGTDGTLNENGSGRSVAGMETSTGAPAASYRNGDSEVECVNVSGNSGSSATDTAGRMDRCESPLTELRTDKKRLSSRSPERSRERIRQRRKRTHLRSLESNSLVAKARDDHEELDMYYELCQTLCRELPKLSEFRSENDGYASGVLQMIADNLRDNLLHSYYMTVLLLLKRDVISRTMLPPSAITILSPVEELLAKYDYPVCTHHYRNCEDWTCLAQWYALCKCNAEVGMSFPEFDEDIKNKNMTSQEAEYLFRNLAVSFSTFVHDKWKLRDSLLQNRCRDALTRGRSWEETIDVEEMSDASAGGHTTGPIDVDMGDTLDAGDLTTEPIEVNMSDTLDAGGHMSEIKQRRQKGKNRIGAADGKTNDTRKQVQSLQRQLNKMNEDSRSDKFAYDRQVQTLQLGLDSEHVRCKKMEKEVALANELLKLEKDKVAGLEISVQEYKADGERHVITNKEQTDKIRELQSKLQAIPQNSQTKQSLETPESAATPQVAILSQEISDLSHDKACLTEFIADFLAAVLESCQRRLAWPKNLSVPRAALLSDRLTTLSKVARARRWSEQTWTVKFLADFVQLDSALQACEEGDVKARITRECLLEWVVERFLHRPQGKEPTSDITDLRGAIQDARVFTKSVLEQFRIINPEAVSERDVDTDSELPTTENATFSNLLSLIGQSSTYQETLELQHAILRDLLESLTAQWPSCRRSECLAKCLLYIPLTTRSNLTHLQEVLLPCVEEDHAQCKEVYEEIHRRISSPFSNTRSDEWSVEWEKMLLVMVAIKQRLNVVDGNIAGSTRPEISENNLRDEITFVNSEHAETQTNDHSNDKRLEAAQDCRRLTKELKDAETKIEEHQTSMKTIRDALSLNSAAMRALQDEQEASKRRIGEIEEKFRSQEERRSKIITKLHLDSFKKEPALLKTPNNASSLLQRIERLVDNCERCCKQEEKFRVETVQWFRRNRSDAGTLRTLGNTGRLDCKAFYQYVDIASGDGLTCIEESTLTSEDKSANFVVFEPLFQDVIASWNLTQQSTAKLQETQVQVENGARSTRKRSKASTTGDRTTTKAAEQISIAIIKSTIAEIDNASNRRVEWEQAGQMPKLLKSLERSKTATRQPPQQPSANESSFESWFQFCIRKVRYDEAAIRRLDRTLREQPALKLQDENDLTMHKHTIKVDQKEIRQLLWYHEQSFAEQYDFLRNDIKTQGAKHILDSISWPLGESKSLPDMFATLLKQCSILQYLKDCYAESVRVNFFDDLVAIGLGSFLKDIDAEVSFWKKAKLGGFYCTDFFHFMNDEGFSMSKSARRLRKNMDLTPPNLYWELYGSVARQVFNANKARVNVFSGRSQVTEANGKRAHVATGTAKVANHEPLQVDGKDLLIKALKPHSQGYTLKLVDVNNNPADSHIPTGLKKFLQYEEQSNKNLKIIFKLCEARLRSPKFYQNIRLRNEVRQVEDLPPWIRFLHIKARGLCNGCWNVSYRSGPPEDVTETMLKQWGKLPREELEIMRKTKRDRLK